MALDLTTIKNSGIRIGNYDSSSDSATLYQPGNGYNSEGTRTVSGISKSGLDTSQFENFGAQNSNNPIFSSGRSLGNIDSAGLEGLVSGYANGAASQAKGQAEEAANLSANQTNPQQQAPQDAYGNQLAQAMSSGQQPGQLAPGVANPFAKDSSKLNTASQQSKYQQGFNQAQASGASSPSSAGQGSAVVNQYTGQDNSGSSANVSNFLQTNPLIQQTNQQLMDFLHPATTQANLQGYIDNIAKDRSYLSGLNTQLMNNENIISGTFQDIKDEITKANGWASNSQILAMTNARNQTLIQNDKTLANLISSAQSAVNTDTTLLSDERQMAQQETQTRMSLLDYQQKNNEFMFNAANDTYKTLMQNDPQGLYNSLVSNPEQAQRFTSITGLSPDVVKNMADPKTGDFADYPQYKKDAQANGHTPLNATDWLAQKNATAAKLKASEAYGTAFNTALGKAAGEAKAGGNNSSNPIPIVSSTGKSNGLSFNAPSTIAPYVNFAANGVKYVDLSGFKGTPTEANKAVQDAQAAGYKVITDKNNANDVQNITDAMSKLESMRQAFNSVAPASAAARDTFGAAAIKAATLLQSDPNAASNDVYVAAALDVLKALSGTRGFRGGASMVKTVEDIFPSNTNTQAVNNGKIDKLQSLINDRQTALVGKPSASDQMLIDENVAKNTIVQYANKGADNQNKVNTYAESFQKTMGRQPTSQELLKAYPELQNVNDTLQRDVVTGKLR